MLPRITSRHGERIDAPVLFFSTLGNLHDAKIRLIEWNPVQGELALMLDDLYSNFAGLPEHPGGQPVRLTLSIISHLEIAVTADRFPLRIVDFEVEEGASATTMQVVMDLGPSGSMRVTCDSIACRAA